MHRPTRNVLTLLVLKENVTQSREDAKGDEFQPKFVDQLRVLKLVP